jgi:hypothetical protein
MSNALKTIQSGHSCVCVRNPSSLSRPHSDLAAGQIIIFSGASMSFSGKAIDVFEGGDVDLAGARWTAKVQSDDSLSLTVAVTSDDRSQVRNSLREDMNHEVTERKADVGAIGQLIDTYMLQIEEVPFFGEAFVKKYFFLIKF